MIIREAIINVAGGQIWSEKISTEATKDLPPLICLHGGPGSTHDLLKYGLVRMVDKFPIIFYDQLGSGKSELSADNSANNNLWTIERFVSELAALIEFYELQEFNLLGTSWGSSLALEYYFRAKMLKPNKLILGSPLVSTAMWLDDANKLKAQMPTSRYQTMLRCEKNNTTDSEEYQEVIDEFCNRHVLRQNELNAEQISFLNTTERKFNSSAYNYMWGPSEFFASGTLLSYDRFADLAQITIPVLFIGGEFDEATPETLTKFCQQTPYGKVVTIKNASHCGYFECPEDYSQAVCKFLN